MSGRGGEEPRGLSAEDPAGGAAWMGPGAHGQGAAANALSRRFIQTGDRRKSSETIHRQGSPGSEAWSGIRPEGGGASVRLHPGCLGGAPRWRLGPHTQTVVETDPAGLGHPLGRDRQGKAGWMHLLLP